MNEPDRALTAPIDDGFCIGCGRHSDIGLHMEFNAASDDAVESRVMLPRNFQGWQGVAHGGAVALVLDEAMAYAAGARGVLGVTADLTVRFRAPVPTLTPLTVRAAVRWQRQRVLRIAAVICDAAGTELATGEASFVVRGQLEPGQRLGA